jgi:hypothetical protein
MEYIEDTVEEIQPDGSVVLRRVITPALSRPKPAPVLDYDVPHGIIPMGDPIAGDNG